MRFSSQPWYTTTVEQHICTAARSFGKFKDSFLAEIHAEISSHVQQEESGLPPPQPVQGIVVHDSEVLAPEPVRAGGLVRNDAVSYSRRNLDYRPDIEQWYLLRH